MSKTGNVAFTAYIQTFFFCYVTGVLLLDDGLWLSQ